MSILASLAIAAAAAGNPPVVVEGERARGEDIAKGFGYAELATGDDRGAIADIRENGSADAADPARLINLGIAYARIGDTAQARALFEQARDSRDSARLETAEGKWIAARALAERGLRMLDDGVFSDGTRLAGRRN